MVQALHNGDHMEFFIEGSRSRSGKSSSPKAGLLSVLVDTLKEGEWEGGRERDGLLPHHSQLSFLDIAGVVQDILIVPVSIGYDKVCVVAGGFCIKQMDCASTCHLFTSLSCAIAAGERPHSS